MIEENVGGVDRIARTVVAVVVAIGGVAAGTGVLPGGALAGAVLFAASAGLAFTAVTKRCLANYALGVDTCRVPDSE